MALTDEQLEALGSQVADLTTKLGEMTTALDSMVKSQSQYTQSLTDAKNKNNNLAAAAENAGKALTKKAELEAKIAQEEKNREAARESAEKNAIRSIASFGDALFSTEKGFGKFSGSLGSAGDAAFELGKSFGLLGTVIGAIVKVGTSVGEAFLKQADAQNNFVTEVYKMGGISGQSSENLTDLAREAGYSAGELDKLTPSLKAAGRGLATLGTSTGDGTTSLLKLFNVGNDVEKEFFRIGYSLEELNKTQADYIELQRISGVNLRSRTRDEDQLKRETLAYATNLRALSDLTGKSAEAIQQEQAAAQSAYENVVANRQDEARIRQLQTEAANETNQERKAQLEREIAELENAGRVRNAAIGQMAGVLGQDFGEQFGRILRTGTFDELTGPLANLFSQSGLDPADIKKRFEGVEAGSDEFNALIADIQGNLRSGIDKSLLMLGDSIQFGGTQMGEAFGLAAKLIENSAVLDPDGEIQQARARAIQDQVDSTKAAGDAQRDYAAATESFTRDMRVTADAMLDAMNPLTGQMDLLKGGMTALAVAVGAATLALGAMAASRGVRALREMGRSGRGPSRVGDTIDDLIDESPDNTRRGSRLGRAARGLGRFAGGAARFAGRALPIASVAMGGYDAYQGFAADTSAPLSQRFMNAGSSALSGLTFGLLGSNPEEIAARARARPAEETSTETEQRTSAETELPAVKPISEMTTAEEFSEERNRLDQLVQQNTITRQEQLDLLGELRDRERELAETAYQARQFVGPPTPTPAPVPIGTAQTPTVGAAPAQSQETSITTQDTSRLNNTSQMTLPRSSAPIVAVTQTPEQTVSRITPTPASQNTSTNTAATTTQTTNTSSNELNDLMTLLSYKLDNVIGLLEAGVSIQDRLLLESRN